NPSFPPGYEASIMNTKPGDEYQPGSLGVARPGAPDLVSIRESPVRSGEWFRMDVIAEGNHIVIKVNSKTTAAYTDDKQSYLNGHVALKYGNPQTVAEFRKIEIKELPAKATESSSSRPADHHPPDAKEAAAKAYEKACKDARAKLLKEF